MAHLFLAVHVSSCVDGINRPPQQAVLEPRRELADVSELFTNGSHKNLTEQRLQQAAVCASEALQFIREDGLALTHQLKKSIRMAGSHYIFAWIDLRGVAVEDRAKYPAQLGSRLRKLLAPIGRTAWR